MVWIVFRKEHIKNLKETDPNSAKDLVQATISASKIWKDNVNNFKDEYKRIAKEKRDQFNKEVKERGIREKKKSKPQSLLKTRCSPKRMSEIMNFI